MRVYFGISFVNISLIVCKFL